MELLETLKKRALETLEKVADASGLAQWEIEIFGRKQGELTRLLRSLRDLPEAERRKIGAGANKLREKLEEELNKKRAFIKKQTTKRELLKEKVDITFPGTRHKRGHLHPLTQIRLTSEHIFTSLGFAIIEGPEIETEFYNFDALNMAGHSARDMQETFWLDKSIPGKNRYVPRTQVTGIQVRFMERHNPPFRIVYSGTCFRREATDASHEFQFDQLECLMVDKDITVANLKYILHAFFEKLFGKGVEIRLRPSYFPFTEPSFEVDITCIGCSGRGCSICKQSGWVELLGAGMVNQKVFKAAGYVPRQWQGFAFGMGLDRIAMMKYKIPDIRLFRQNDIRFLQQF